LAGIGPERGRPEFVLDSKPLKTTELTAADSAQVTIRVLVRALNLTAELAEP